MAVGHEWASAGPGSVTFALKSVPMLAPASGSSAVAGSAIAPPCAEDTRSLVEAQVTSGATSNTTAISVFRDDDCNFNLVRPPLRRSRQSTVVARAEGRPEGKSADRSEKASSCGGASGADGCFQPSIADRGPHLTFSHHSTRHASVEPDVSSSISWMATLRENNVLM